ncbi:MAG: hypothetical protein IMZ50_08385 [Candidatus Atribacteria bacterium]|nr:hypothetical protein [Candidatus Atribacteria bacterium]
MTVVHPFHPECGKQFELISVQRCWGEPRVTYRNEDGTARTVPISWTTLEPPDLFLEVSAGRSIVHPKDLSSLQQLVRSLTVWKSTEDRPGDGSRRV